MSLRIYSTLSRAMLPLLPIEPGHVRMYVCGMTVYDLCHLGHARSMVAFDVVQRNKNKQESLISSGCSVKI